LKCWLGNSGCFSMTGVMTSINSVNAPVKADYGDSVWVLKSFTSGKKIALEVGGRLNEMG
jgi:hypothetical protein